MRSVSVPASPSLPVISEYPLKPLSAPFALTCTAQYLACRLPRPFRVISSAPCRGGAGQSSGWLNLRVDKHAPAHESPQQTLVRAIGALGLPVDSIGMMTAASMDSWRLGQAQRDGLAFWVLVTTGLENARAAGDPADVGALLAPQEAGTINLAVFSAQSLTPAAEIEALALITEAKVRALQELGVRSPISGRPATGTGTDALALFSDPKGPCLAYIGKHVLAGELLAEAVLKAVQTSAAWCCQSA